MITPPQQEAIKTKKQKILRRMVADELGQFYFILAESQFPDLPPEVVTRLIYLYTYVNYKNRLMLTLKKPMQKSDLATIMNVSTGTLHSFWSAVKDKYIGEDKRGLYLKNKNIIRKGELPKKCEYKTYQKCYIKWIRQLYNATPTSKHKHLGYVFKMLPYINVEYNIVCSNPLETDLTKIESLTLMDFCNAIDYDISQATRLQKTYSKIKFDVDGKQELFCAFVFDGANSRKSRIFVNPHILFNGSNYKQVEILGAFC